MKYHIWNKTKQNFVKEDDHTTIASFDDIKDVQEALDRIKELSQFNPKNKEDKFIIKRTYV